MHMCVCGINGGNWQPLLFLLRNSMSTKLRTRTHIVGVKNK